MDKPLDLLQGTLDMLILKAISLGPLHGYGILLRIQQISKERLEIQQGSLYNTFLHEELCASNLWQRCATSSGL
jgi:DNA-binding PadR family transcriptional regulator